VRLVAAGSSERIKAALGRACYAGLRLGEVRALAWVGRGLRGRSGQRPAIRAAGRDDEGTEDGVNKRIGQLRAELERLNA
jgi:hypothetical protein